MSSRLDRLFILLENGGSAVTRKAAAQQLGEVIKVQPKELNHLLDRLYPYITAKSWETRIAAGQAVETLATNVPQWEPLPSLNNENVEPEPCGFSLSSFCITHVLKRGSFLLSTDEEQFSEDQTALLLNPNDRAAQQRQLVNQKLGLDEAEKLGVDTKAIFSNSDLVVSDLERGSPVVKDSIVEIINSEMVAAGMVVNCRELNMSKRRNHLYSKQKSIDVSDGPSEKRPRLMNSASVEDKAALKEEKYVDLCDENEWPFENFTETLKTDLFSASWETRHGVATALREVIKLHGKGAGISRISYHQQMQQHSVWLQDMAVRLVCVLALDRFGDFLSDQVVAPVRETCAQALGCLVRLMSQEDVFEVLQLLVDMLEWPEWPPRHGGLLGIKYLLAVREDIIEELLRKSYNFILKALLDEIDDVVAVAAGCLVPVADKLVKVLEEDSLRHLVGTLWNLLLDIDDITSCTDSILMLLARLLPHIELSKCINLDISQNLSRLWSFFYHSSFCVRNSALQTLDTLSAPQVPHIKETSASCETANSSSHSPTLSVGNSDLNSTENKEGESETKTDCESSSVEAKGDSSLLVKELGPALIHLYQRSLLESHIENQQLLLKIWIKILRSISVDKILLVVCPLISSWLFLLTANPRFPYEPGFLLIAQYSRESETHKKCLQNSSLGEPMEMAEAKYYIGNAGEVSDLNEKNLRAVNARCTGAKLLGCLSEYVIQPMPGMEYLPDETPVICYLRILDSHLSSKAAMRRFNAAAVIREWALSAGPVQVAYPSLIARLHTCLTEIVFYDEIAQAFTKLQQDAKDFISMLQYYKVDVNPPFALSSFLTLDQIKNLSGSYAQDLLVSSKLRPKVFDNLENKRKSILSCVVQTSCEQISLSITTQAMLAGAVAQMDTLPEKLNPVIKPLMDSVKKERNKELQRTAALDLTHLIDNCISKQPNACKKIIRNLSIFLCADSSYTPKILPDAETASDKSEKYTGIISLSSCCLKNSSNTGMNKVSSKPLLRSDSITDADILMSEDLGQQALLQRQGCTSAFTAIMSHFGAELPAKLPFLWTQLVEPFSSREDAGTDEGAQGIVNWLQLLQVVIPPMHPSLFHWFEEHLSSLEQFLCHKYAAVRHMVARVLGELALVLTGVVMNHLIENIVPLLGDIQHSSKRQGAVEAVHVLIEKLKLDIVPYIVLLIVPLLGRMSDPDTCVRTLATQCFASLVQLLPLERGLSDSTSLNVELQQKRIEERLFLDQLIDPKKITNYVVQVPISADLRSYQQEGVNWLAFLNKYKLHGILCDDMGLGKTLQSICILAGDNHDRSQSFQETSSPEFAPLPSLVICPPTLTGHWIYEVQKFISSEHLSPLHYIGPPLERLRLQAVVPDHNLIVASYDIVRNDIEFFRKIKWNYVILDEGHIIKNCKTKSFKAVKQLVANHRIILTGTPIQNNVLELWSLFDFLMPGFLGTEKQFAQKYSKPILLARESKSSSKDQEAGIIAMESLHRQALPFILRRLKEDVLEDLPPKITQDYFCEMSPLQKQLYEDFARSQHGVAESLAQVTGDEESRTQCHIFQALQYLRRVCNHPKLVLSPSHPEYKRVTEDLKGKNSSIGDISCSAKLGALKQLLYDCGIGQGSGTDSVVSPHRALIFCQLKTMLDIIENDLLKAHMSGVTYLRVDGTVPAGSRHSLIQKFNSDPSIDLLLLTTQVGGLGLNLTGADTVIFVEHDWNPMRDLQAMDRAHRIGQKKVVNVYRLITRGTLEEKIMGLQKFKLLTANTVITTDNASMLTMGTEQLLDLFAYDEQKELKGALESVSRDKKARHGTGLPGSVVPSVLEKLPELWDESQYENEYDFSSFVASLNKKGRSHKS